MTSSEVHNKYDSIAAFLFSTADIIKFTYYLADV
jgi:hypothetical protein